MNLQRGQGGLRALLVFFLCALYFGLAMGLTLLSSGIYREAAASSDATYAERTALFYLVNQVRRADAAGGVALISFGDGDALALREGDYVTLLYCYGGQLMELYTEEGTGLGPADGTAILPMAALELSESGGLITITADGSSTSLAPRCGIDSVGEVTP